MIELCPEPEISSEILCSLPVEPAAVSMDDLCHDFGVKMQTLKYRMGVIVARGIQLVFSKNNGAKEVAIARASAKDAKTIAQAYWDARYKGPLYT